MNKELRLYGKLMQIFLNAPPTLEKMRKSHERTKKAVERQRPEGIRCEEKHISRKEKEDLRVYVLEPQEPSGKATGILSIHGGGYVMGVPEADFRFNKEIIDATGSVIVSPEYTLALDKPFPAALEDCYDALCWMTEHADELGIRPDQIFVIGGSAGGGLTAALCLYARDKGEVSIAFQMPLYPMLDDRMQTPSAKDSNPPIWSSVTNAFAWNLYLDQKAGTDGISKYAAPARETDYTGLPPAYSLIGSVDLFVDETKEYFANLKKAGVPAKLDIYDGCFHGFEQTFRKTRVGTTAAKAYLEALKYAVEHYFAEQPG